MPMSCLTERCLVKPMSKCGECPVKEICIQHLLHKPCPIPVEKDENN